MGWGSGGGGWGCNRVYLHIVFVLLYSVCHSVNITSISFFYVWTSCNCIIILLGAIILDVTKRHRESARKSERRHQLPLVHAIEKKKEKNKRKKKKLKNLWLGFVCCLLPTCWFHHSVDRLHGKKNYCS